MIAIGGNAKMNQVYYDEYGNKKVCSASNKVFYDENGNKILMNTGRGIIGYGLCGVVYPYGEGKCLKYITSGAYTNFGVIKDIKELALKQFYKIYTLLFNRNHDFNGYIMKYYQSEDIDILTMPIAYTLDNLSGIIQDTKVISEANILFRDLHSENIIFNNNGMTIIDVDNFDYSQIESPLEFNIDLVYGLFRNIYIESLVKNHKGSLEAAIVIRNLINNKARNLVYDELKGYKYPIDYIKKKSLEPVKYVMKKGV